MGRTALAADSSVLKHDPGFGHPEQPARYRAVMEGLKLTKLLDKLDTLPIEPVGNDSLALVHTEEYLQLVSREVSSHRRQLSTGDTAINAFSEYAARIAAGCAIAAVDSVCGQSGVNAFAVTRPPGHHASADTGMGFCLFNNVAIAARHAQKRWGIDRVLIVDWDVHHGNGTQDIFYHDGSVLFFSTHQSPWYPGTGDSSETGEGKAKDLIVNCPLPAGTGRHLIFQAFEQALLPKMGDFRPELILLSAGFDSRFADPLGQFQLNDRDFYDLTVRMMDIADQYAQGRMVSILEGGYNLEGLSAAAVAHVSALTSGFNKTEADL